MSPTTPTPAIAIIYGDDSAAASMMRIIASAGMSSESFHSLNDFLVDDELDKFECLVLDSALLDEGASGKALEEHREQQAQEPVPIVVLSNTDDSNARRRARSFGAAAFFHEPVDGEALLDAIRWVLSNETHS